MYTVGSIAMCTRDGAAAPVQVLATETRQGSEVFCYIHYLGLDKRWDEWVSSARLSRPEGAAGDAATAAAAEAEGSRHASKRRRVSLPTESLTSPRAVSASPSPSLPYGLVPLQHEGSAAYHAFPEDEARAGGRISGHGAGHDDERAKVRNITRVQFGPYLIDAWYFSPYPGCVPPTDPSVDTLYVCEHTLKYTANRDAFAAQQAALLRERNAASLVPPGLEVYRDDSRGLSVFMIQGSKHRLYCQNLCLLGKLFIEHKTLHFDPDPFFFYLLVERAPLSGVPGSSPLVHRPVGYFSKEIDSPDGYNLACILTLPPHQRKGYGKFIISFSYALSLRQARLGAPEKPLSDLGKVSYRRFWSCRLLMLLHDACVSKARPTVKSLAEDTGIKQEDVISTLQAMGFIKHLKGSFVLAVSKRLVDAQLEPFIEKRFTDGFAKDECFLVTENLA